MEIYMQKIGLIRDDVNPKNLSLNLDIDWAVEYTNTDQEMIDFDISYTLVQKLENDDEKDGFIVVSEKKIDINEVVLADLILNVPMKHLCNDGCKGLCAGCGKNLNQAECDCKEDKIDPRLAALRQLLD